LRDRGGGAPSSFGRATAAARAGPSFAFETLSRVVRFRSGAVTSLELASSAGRLAPLPCDERRSGLALLLVFFAPPAPSPFDVFFVSTKRAPRFP
jgi:hypothetical protein